MKRKAILLLMAETLSCCLTFADNTGSTALSRRITLREAVQLALKHNHNVRIAGYAVDSDQPRQLGYSGGNADSSCEQRPEPRGPQHGDERHTDNAATNVASEDQARKRYRAS